MCGPTIDIRRLPNQVAEIWMYSKPEPRGRHMAHMIEQKSAIQVSMKSESHTDRHTDTPIHKEYILNKPRYLRGYHLYRTRQRF